MRLFVALDIDSGIRERIARFLDGVRGFAPEARWVRPESLHVTLKFIGEKADDDIEKVKRQLQEITADGFEMNFRGYGFFPGTRMPRVFWIGVEADSKLTSWRQLWINLWQPLTSRKKSMLSTLTLRWRAGKGRSGAPAGKRASSRVRRSTALTGKTGQLSLRQSSVR